MGTPQRQQNGTQSAAPGSVGRTKSTVSGAVPESGSERQTGNEGAVLSRLVKSAPGLFAKSYAARLNQLFGWNRSAAELLFDVTRVDLTVIIDATHDNSTVSALQMTRAVEIVAIRRPSSKKPSISVEVATKVQMGDELTLRGQPHVLAAIAMIKAGKIVLAPRHTREKLASLMRSERQTLHKAAVALQQQMWPLVTARLAENRARRRERNAVVMIQARRRGQLLRRSTKGMREAHRAQRKAAKLQARKLLAGLLRASHHGSICTPMCFQASDDESRAASDAARAAWVRENPGKAMWFAKQTVTARAHTSTLNRLVQAASEAKRHQRGALSPLGLLLSGEMELTAVVDKRGNNVTVGALDLPKTVAVVRLTVNSRSVSVKNQASLNATKLLTGDSLILRGLPHHVATVTERGKNEGGRLVILPKKARKGTGETLQLAHDSLMTSALRLARSLQRVARQRIALRRLHMRSHAALVIQIQWSVFVANRMSRAISYSGHASASEIASPTGSATANTGPPGPSQSMSGGAEAVEGVMDVTTGVQKPLASQAPAQRRVPSARHAADTVTSARSRPPIALQPPRSTMPALPVKKPVVAGHVPSSEEPTQGQSVSSAEGSTASTPLATPMAAQPTGGSSASPTLSDKVTATTDVDAIDNCSGNQATPCELHPFASQTAQLFERETSFTTKPAHSPSKLAHSPFKASGNSDHQMDTVAAGLLAEVLLRHNISPTKVADENVMPTNHASHDVSQAVKAFNSDGVLFDRAAFKPRAGSGPKLSKPLNAAHATPMARRQQSPSSTPKGRASVTPKPSVRRQPSLTHQPSRLRPQARA